MEIDLDDVISFINEDASAGDCREIIDAIRDDQGNGFIEDVSNDEFITYDNLHDREKVLILKKLFDKYSLQQLQRLELLIKV